LIFLGELLKSACGCGAVNGGFVEIASNFAMCLKPKENQYILHAFLLLDGAWG
jgi:hypothetical protein